MNRREEKMSNQGMYARRQITETACVDEINILLHEQKQSFRWGASVDSACLTPADQDSGGSQRILGLVVNPGLIGDQFVHLENVGKRKWSTSWRKTFFYPGLGRIDISRHQFFFAPINPALT
jgi:hypothetical protein